MASFLGSLDISATGLTAQRLRMDVISSNIANVSTTRTENGGPYKKKSVIFEEMKGDSFAALFDRETDKLKNDSRGVKVREIVTDNSEGPMEYDPEHPDANENGYVEKSNVNIVTEMVNMISASRSYEANITAFNTTKTMIANTLEIAR
jgi:flagellar basal-body rod protein FlgC